MAQVPPGALSGQYIQVQVSSYKSMTSQAMQQFWMEACAYLGGVASLQPDKSATCLVTVQVPPGTSAGQKLTVRTALGCEFMVQVPAGVLSGQYFQVQCPNTTPQAMQQAWLELYAALGNAGQA